MVNTMNETNLNRKIQDSEDRVAIREIIDNYSIWADMKEPRKQAELFSETGIIESYLKDPETGELKLISKLTGRKEIGDGFENFLKNFQTVYHFNGQNTVTLQGKKADGISYCMVTLINVETGKKVKTSYGIHYHDEYVRENNQWLFAKRTTVFDWQDKEELDHSLSKQDV